MVIPQNRSAELTLLGMAFLTQEAAEKVAALPEDTFSYADTVNLFKGIRKVVERRGKPDLVTTAAAMHELGFDTGVELIEASRLAITAANYGQYETILLDLRRRRNLIKACTDVSAKMGDMSENVEDQVKKLLAVMNDNADAGQSTTLRDALMRLLLRLDEKKESGISTGIAGLDALTGGFKPGQLIYLGARPAVGKSALALFMAAHVADHSGPVLVVSLEMEDEALAARVVAEYTRVNVEKLENNSLEPEDFATVWGQAPAVSEIPIRFAEHTVTVMQIRREAQKMIREEGLKMIVVDYLQLMRSDEKTGSKYEEVTQISRDLKLLAMELKVPILALTQLNRGSEGTNGTLRRKPSMSDSRDSGAIEQDANIYLTLYAPDEPKAGTPAHEFWEACQRDKTEWQVLTIEKNRQGRCGQVSLKFDKPHMTFTTMMPGDRAY
ncbi:MAG: AAA family ATPase [Clostridia bacterium]|nr:AAA family ATPase [Clostridia bacterium]